MAYSPSLHSLTAKPMGFSQANPTDARSYFYDTVNFVYRPYQSTSEVLSELNLAKYRTGQFSIFINLTGTLNPGGTFTGGTITEWWFRDGTSNSDLILKTNGIEIVQNFQNLTSGNSVVISDFQPTDIILVYRNGLYKRSGIDYTQTGSTITFNTSFGSSAGAAIIGEVVSITSLR